MIFELWLAFVTTSTALLLILGADGFSGRHLTFGLRTTGWQVLW